MGINYEGIMINQSDLFINALENRDLGNIQRIPKTDLHNHFFLSGHRDYIWKRTGISIPALTQKLNSMDEMHQWVGKHINDLFDSSEKRVLAIEACFQQAQEDGITVLETGDDVWANEHFYRGNLDALIDTFQGAHCRIAP